MFKEVINCPYFTNHDTILLLNKVDIFEKKLKKKRDLSIFFPQFKYHKNDDPVQEGIKFIYSLYQEVFDEWAHKNKNIDGSKPHLTFFATCATSTSSISDTFNAFNQIINQKNVDINF